MKICSRLSVFLAMVGWFVANDFAYGDYPSPKALLGHLLGKYWDADKHFKRAFGSVRQYAKSARLVGASDPRFLIGEEDNRLEWPKDQRLWRWYSQTDSPFKVLIDGSYVFCGQSLDKLLKECAFQKRFCPSETDEETWLYPEADEETVREKRFASVREMLKTLTSKVFTEQLLGEDTVKAFLTVRKGFETQVRVCLSPDSLHPFRRVGVFLEYVQVEKITKEVVHLNEKWLLRIGFHAVWDAEADCFADDEVQLSSFLSGNLHLGSKVENRCLLTNKQLKAAYGIRGLSLQRKKITTEKRPIAMEKQPKSCRSEKSVPSRKPKKRNKVVVF